MTRGTVPFTHRTTRLLVSWTGAPFQKSTAPPVFPPMRLNLSGPRSPVNVNVPDLSRAWQSTFSSEHVSSELEHGPPKFPLPLLPLSLSPILSELFTLNLNSASSSSPVDWFCLCALSNLPRGLDGVDIGHFARPCHSLFSKSSVYQSCSIYPFSLLSPLATRCH